jgi:hypothetical protein
MTKIEKNMEFTLSEEALVIAALSSHEFKLKRQMNLFRKGLDDVSKNATEREIHAAGALRDKLLKVATNSKRQA